MYPLQQALMRGAGFRREDNATARRAKLARFLSDRLGNSQTALALFATLLSIGDREDEAYLDQHIPDRAALALEFFVDLTLKAAEDAPVIVVLEDAHWADPSTISYCRMLWRTDRRSQNSPGHRRTTGMGACGGDIPRFLSAFDWTSSNGRTVAELSN